jgi:hypothetical protein
MGSDDHWHGGPWGHAKLFLFNAFFRWMFDPVLTMLGVDNELCE